MTQLSKQEHHSSDITLQNRSDMAVLSEQDRELLKECYNREWSMPRYKMKHFVGESQYTPYGTLKQYMVEIKTREGTIELLELEAQHFEIEMKMHLRDAEALEEVDSLKAALSRIEAGKAEINWNRSRKRCAEQYFERNTFLSLARELLDSPQGKTPDGRSLLEVFDTPEAEQYEYHYWTVRMANQAAMDMLAYGRIGAGNMEAIQQMGQQQQVEVIGLANHLNLTLDMRQNGIRQEIGNLLNVVPPKQTHIGDVAADNVNALIKDDIAKMKKELEDKSNKNEKDQGLNDVYNV